VPCAHADVGDPGDPFAGKRLVELMVARGDVGGLRARVAAGDRDAAGRLANLVAQRGRVEEAMRMRL
jgi:hypothetical protein